MLEILKKSLPHLMTPQAATKHFRNMTEWLDVKRMAQLKLGQVSEETILEYFPLFLNVYKGEKACETCNSINNCPNNGYVPVLGMESNGVIYDKRRECNKASTIKAQQALDKHFKSSGIPYTYKEKSLSDFEVNPGNKLAFESTSQFCRQGGRGLALIGPPGIGKTHLAAVMATNRFGHGDTVLFATVPDLLSDLRASINNNNTHELIEKVKVVDTLILDDLGTENASGWVRERMYEIVNHRVNAGKTTIITTNYRPSELIERFGGGIEAEKLVSRLEALCDWIYITGRDKRLETGAIEGV